MRAQTGLNWGENKAKRDNLATEIKSD